ncbi:hypothetical protein KEM54_005381 [Ascosphaera aggregata]|nr:hypothetical protein KEM54_005381 [Ascosphaera aggregata]
MLTAELEGFHVKCHPYWKSGNYGQFKVEELGQQVIPLEPESGWHPKSLPSSDGDGEKNQASIAESFPGLGTNEAKTPIAVIIRRLRVTADECSIQTVRDVVQVQFSGWPDFGRPTKPAHLLRLIDVCHSIFKETNTDGSAAADSEPVPPNQRNIVVHCSAGCGRTGTFCTIDSVIDMLKHQRASRGKPDQWTESSQWMYQDDIDLIAETVEEFRHQRLSMVQTLQQFVLCYESILEWIAGQEMRR